MREINWHKVIEKAQVLNSFWVWFSQTGLLPHLCMCQCALERCNHQEETMLGSP